MAWEPIIEREVLSTAYPSFSAAGTPVTGPTYNDGRDSMDRLSTMSSAVNGTMISGTTYGSAGEVTAITGLFLYGKQNLQRTVQMTSWKGRRSLTRQRRIRGGSGRYTRKWDGQVRDLLPGFREWVGLCGESVG